MSGWLWKEVINMVLLMHTPPPIKKIKEITRGGGNDAKNSFVIWQKFWKRVRFLDTKTYFQPMDLALF